MTEFGATKSAPLLADVTAQFDADKVGWIYWAWKYYGDPTGSAAESLVMADGHLRSTAQVLSQAYPEAVAGTPSSFSFSPVTDVFELAYVPNHRVHAPTVVFVPDLGALPAGLLRPGDGGRVVSAAGQRPARGRQPGDGSTRSPSRVTAGRCGRVRPA